MTPHRAPFRSAPLVLAALLAGLSPGCKKGAEPAKEDTPPAPVEVTKAATGQRLEQWTELLGTTQPLPGRSGLISAAVGGKVAWVLGDGNGGKRLQEGQWVKKGDVVVQLDDRVLQANLTKMLAAQRKLGDQKKQAEVAISQARVEVNRLRNLREQRITVAESDIKKAELTLEDAQLKRDAVETDRQAGLADIAALRAELALYSLKAPIDGKLSRLEVRPGESLSAGSRVAEIANLRGEIDVLCYVPPAAIDRIREGLDAELVAPDGSSGSPLPHGKVVFKADQAQPETGNFPVKVRFPNDRLKRLANEVARVRVLTEVKDGCTTLPDDALLEDSDPPQVVVAWPQKEKKEGKEKTVYKAYKLPVQVGVRDRAKNRFEIQKLLPPENTENNPLAKKLPRPEDLLYVVKGAYGLQDGDEVKPEEEGKKEEKEEK